MQTIFRTAIVFAIGIFLSMPLAASAVFSPQTTLIDTNGQNPYATFQSHNQKIVENQYGIFLTYITGENNPIDPQKFTWYLMRSTDGGKSFSKIYTGTRSYPPVLETDSSGNIYLIESNTAVLSDAYLLRFSPSNNFTNPQKTVIPQGGAYKFAAVIDEARSQLYFTGSTLIPGDLWGVERFYIIGLNGVVKSNVVLTQPGTSRADAHYPLLYLDTNGDLYMAWSTVVPGNYTYWSIHVIRSKDGGLTWENLEKTPLSVPIVADESGQTTRINLDDEFGPTGTWASTWLSSFIVKNGKAHFAYRALTQPTRQHYVRYDLKTGKKDKDIFPIWKGEKVSIENLDGFFSTTPGADSPLYYISAQKNSPQIAGLYSLDNGDTWKDYVLGKSLPLPGASSRLPGTLSVSKADPAYPAAYAVDGNFSTQWIANLTPTTDNNNAWVILDLGAVYVVDALKWKGGMWQPYPAQSPADYTIEIAQQEGRWTTVATRTNPIGVIDGYEAIGKNARYIRLKTTKVNEGSGWALSFSEIWAEGTVPSSSLYSIGGSRLPASDGSVLSTYTEVVAGAPYSTARFMKIPAIIPPAPRATFVSASAINTLAPTAATEGLAEFKITFDVTALGDAIYLDRSVTYDEDRNGTNASGDGFAWIPTPDSNIGITTAVSVAANSIDANDTQDLYKIELGKTRRFTYTSVAAIPFGKSGILAMSLTGMNWTANPTATADKWYTKNLGDFKTGTLSYGVTPPPAPTPVPTPTPTICGTINKANVYFDQGKNYIADSVVAGGDTLQALTQSKLTLYENGKALGPAHTNLADLRALGGGRFLHWNNSIYFTSTDGTDPRTNGRAYTYGGVCEPSPEPLPVMCGMVNIANTKLDSGNGYVANGVVSGGDTLETGNVSNLVLYENGKKLGPAHTLHANIRTQGLGRYSHWYNNLFFSASDNTDPRTNGRTYAYSGVCGNAPVVSAMPSPAQQGQEGSAGLSLMAAVGAIATAPFKMATDALAKIFVTIGLY